MSSQNQPSSQISQNDDFLSDSSAGDLFSDLPDAFIEKLLHLERPSTGSVTKATEHYPIANAEDAMEVSRTPILTPTIHSTIRDHTSQPNESLTQSLIDNLDEERLVEDVDFFELPKVIESPKRSSPMEEIEFDMDVMNEEETSAGREENTSSNEIPEGLKSYKVVGGDPEVLIQRPLQNYKVADAGSAISTQCSPILPSVAQPPRQISLRARTKIQLKPFTLEASKFNELIGYTSAKSKITYVVNDNDDESDTDFTPSNTQAVDDLMDNISTYQDTQDILPNSSKMMPQRNDKNDNHQNAKSKGKGRATAIIEPKKRYVPNLSTNSASSSRPTNVENSNSVNPEPSSTVRPVPPASQDNADDVFDFEKYGLNKLIIPPPRKSRDKGKSKIITFAKKKKGSQKIHSSTTPRVPYRFMEKTTSDIFDFDFSPKSNLNIVQKTPAASNEPSPASMNDRSPVSINESIDDIEDPIEGYETPQESSQPNTPSATTTNDGIDIEMIEDDDDEVPVFKRLRKRKKIILDSDDDEEVSHTNTTITDFSFASEDDEPDSLFDFPTEIPTSSRSHSRIVTENEIIPIVEDEFEYRDAKRQRLGIKDLKKATLKNILPASFFKVNQRRIEEEERMREQRRREAKAAKLAKKKSSVPSSGATSSIATKATRDTEDVFAAFREDSEQSDDDYEAFDVPEPNIERPDIYTDFDPHLSMFDDTPEFDQVASPSAPIDLTNENRLNNVSPPRRPIPHTSEAPLFSLANQNNRDLPTTAEAIEDNRVTRNRNNDRRARQSIPKSSIAIVKPNNTRVRNPNLIKIKQNPAPSKRRRRKLKRTRDDIYIHTPYYRSHGTGNIPSASMADNQHNFENNNYHQSEHENNSRQNEYDSRGMFVNDKLPRRPFDDIYMNTKQQMWYKNDLVYIGNYDISDYLDQRLTQARFKRSKPTIYTLQYVAKQVEKLVDHELRRVIGLRNTVYWHHHLLQPLLSDTPNRKSAYDKFKETYSSLVLFDQVYHWRHIHHRKGSLLIPLFARVFDDLKHMCNNDVHNKQQDLDGELPGHDHFYVFVSICLTQWIPLYPYESKLQLAEMFANQVRGLSTMVVKLVEGRQFETIPWRAIVKVLLFTLDWTCRLHHLGIDRQAWSVAECIKTIMDVLVYIGYDAIRNIAESRVYVIEAWICILQILSVSDKQAGGYFFNEHIFITSLTDSINKKSRIEELEFEKRKTTRLWAEALNLILTKHMMLL